jgi:hypothetical protein
MAGIPRGPTVIVHANEVLNRQGMLNEEVWRLETLFTHLGDEQLALQWCARRRLVRNTMTCGQCQQLCTLNRFVDGIDGVRWSCRGCGMRKSVRDGSFFSRSQFSLKKILVMTYCWACDMPQTQMAREADEINRGIVIDWCDYMRNECQTWLDANAAEIGGIDANGDSIVVEIDETKYFHRKYHRGQWREGHWVFGGIERETKRCFLVEVPNRRADTLNACIVEHILPGTHIISDGWAAYRHIDQLRQGIYEHSVVIHQHNFVDPQDADVHTQNVENMWMRAKRKLKRQCGTSRDLFPSYLHEFAFRNHFAGDDIFVRFILTLGDNYA